MHTCILGRTGTGKTRAAKFLASKLARVAVCEPVKTDWGAPAIHTTNIDDLLTLAQLNKNLNIFIDEAGEMLKRNDAYQFLATRSRQYGHNVFFIAQRACMLTPVMRNNCESIYAFNQCNSDSKILADDFANEIFLELPKLKKGECIYIKCVGFEPLKIRVF